jgi:hypothetical protein
MFTRVAYCRHDLGDIPALECLPDLGMLLDGAAHVREGPPFDHGEGLQHHPPGFELFENLLGRRLRR